MPTILIVDDEEDMRSMIAEMLKKEGFDSIEASDGLEGLQRAKSERPDLVVLDLMMPGRDGISVCKDLRQGSKTKRIPILMLTALNAKETTIKGLEVGADDYMTKPFAKEEFILRIRSILRRTLSTEGGSEVKVGPFHLDKNNLRLNISDEEVDLTSTEFKLLLSLIEEPGTPKERGDLLGQVWGYSNLSQTRTLDTHIKRLRAKLGQYGSCIETVRSVGYQFNESAQLAGDTTN
ncbi:MAG: response regulator transcription factor [Verrucomicrobiales bacterium]|nr:response regulator transcription factor [Verrucomicrobiales bacterium]